MPGWWIAGSTAVNVGMSLWGANKASNAADAAEEAQIKAMKAQHQYDLDAWDMKRKQLQAQRMERIDGIMLAERNEGKLRAYKDAAAQDQYNYNLRIRDSQQAANEAAYKRSSDIYYDTTDLNMLSAKAAMDSQIVQLEESYDEQAFDKNEAYIEMLQNEGKLRARGASGRTAAKGVQSTLADYGRQMTMLNATEDSLDRGTRAMLDEIIRDKTSADLTAYAQKMLDPGVLPMPIKPQPIPITEYQLPRAFSDFDFGPMPIEGAMPTGLGSQMAWANAITGIGNSIASGINSTVVANNSR